MPIYKDGSFLESWHDVSFNAQVDYNQSGELLRQAEPVSLCEARILPKIQQAFAN